MAPHQPELVANRLSETIDRVAEAFVDGVKLSKAARHAAGLHIASAQGTKHGARRRAVLERALALI